MKKLLTLSIALLTLSVIVTGLIYCRWVKKASLTVANTNPTKTVFVFHAQVSEGQTITSGPHELNPGEERTFTQRFRRVEPNFAVFAQSNEPEVVRSVYKLTKNHPGIVYYQEDVPDEQIIFQPLNATYVDVPDSEEVGVDISKPSADNLVDLPFVRVPVNSDSLTATFQIRDKQFKGIYSKEGVPSPEQETAVFLARAKLLASVLQRQMYFSKKWPNPDRNFPYRLGMVINDHNGPYMPGLFVEATAPMTIRGDAMPIHAEDILLSFGGQPVFSIEDLNLTVYEWATALDKGIDVPIPFECIRNGQRFTGQTMYFFNESFWGYSDSDRRLAFAYGIGDGITLGNSVEAATVISNGFKLLYNAVRSENSAPKEIKSFKEEVWAGNQTKARLRQMYSSEFDAGSFIGMFCPGPGWFFKLPLARALTRSGVSRVVASLGANATVEIAENVVWTIADASPLQTPKDIIKDLKESVPVMAGMSIAFGSLSRRMVR